MALDDDVRRLSRIPLLADLEADALRLIAFSAEARILRAGDVIFRKDDESDSGYFVMTGSVALDATGDGHTVKVVGPDSLIGEIALIAASKRPATALAREPTTVLKISRTLFHRVLREFPASGARIRKSVAARLVGFTQELAAVSGLADSPSG